MRPEAWGVTRGYRDTSGRRRAAPRSTIDAVLAAMGAGRAAPPPPAVRVARRGEPVAVDGPAELVTEDGAVIPVSGSLPAGLPDGYHRLRRLSDGAETELILSPGTCRMPEAAAWAWAVQLYATRSARSWGIGDLSDLHRLAGWSRRLGAGMVLLNPLHAASPTLPQEASPYLPSSRRFMNPLYLDVESVPGAERLGERLAGLAAAGRRLGSDRRIDRDRVFELKMAALEEIWAGFAGDRGFDAQRRSTPGLEEYATFCALAERHGPSWRRWPSELRHPSAPAVAAFRLANRRRIGFHAWLQWLLDRQLEAAAAAIPLLQDLAVGFSPDGADAWSWQNLLAFDMEVGAPPDHFNSRGQRWGMPPFDPWKLRASGYRPFIETLRACLRHGAGLRIDHVMGLFRLFWIPNGAGPDQGTYVRYHAGDLLDILALESERAGAVVVGEDLGTVEEAIRSELAGRSALSYRVFWFERRPPARYPSRALAAITTHDLPTIAGVLGGADLALQRRLGLEPDGEGMAAMRKRLLSAAGLGEGASLEDLTEAVHRLLAKSPARLVAATLEDALGVEERPNLPGTVAERPNWALALPLTLEQIEADPRPARLAAALERPAGRL